MLRDIESGKLMVTPFEHIRILQFILQYFPKVSRTYPIYYIRIFNAKLNVINIKGMLPISLWFVVERSLCQEVIVLSSQRYISDVLLTSEMRWLCGGWNAPRQCSLWFTGPLAQNFLYRYPPHGAISDRPGRPQMKTKQRAPLIFRYKHNIVDQAHEHVDAICSAIIRFILKATISKG